LLGQYFQVRLIAYPYSGPCSLTFANCVILKYLQQTNTLDYFALPTVMKIQSFVTLMPVRATWVSVSNIIPGK
jgi:hypothetical protein